VRIGYRVAQFWLTLTARPTAGDLPAAQALLSPTQLALFRRMQPGEQAHSLMVLRRLRQAGETNPGLLAAALLHDVGKSILPLHAWQRAAIVVLRALAPAAVRRWGQAARFDPSQTTAPPNLGGWREAFTVAEQHPRWGASLAEQAGASPLTVALIRCHQDDGAHPELEPWLSKLRAVDDES
jgi:hypothetical protein